MSELAGSNVKVSSPFQVTSSCTSVYVDGSETRGAIKAEVTVKYGTLSGSAHFTVWYPKTPLNIQLDDNKLSQVKTRNRRALAKRYSTPFSDIIGNCTTQPICDDSSLLECNREVTNR